MSDDSLLKRPSHPRYEILEEIGRGGMGVVYRVEDLDLNRVLAMKVLSNTRKASSADAQTDYYARFLEEVQVTAQLDHPAIVPVHDLGFQDNGTPYYTMRFVKGRHLGDIIELAQAEKEGWNLARLIDVLVKVCQALAHAHAKGVLHRDLKPANIMVGDLGEVYVMDWGLARMLGQEDVRDIRIQLDHGDPIATIGNVREGDAATSLDAPLLTMDGGVIGTPAYMPPEQAEGRIDDIDQVSDVYALGAILYQMLAGHPPYMPTHSTVTAREVLTELRDRPPERVRRLDVKLPPELVAVCEKAMARIQSERYSTALSLAEDLQAYLDGRVVRAHQTGALVEFRKWVLRNKAVAAVVGLLGLSLIAFTLLQSLSKRKLDLANTKLTSTLADTYTNQGLNTTSPARAALWFNAAARLQEEDPAALYASRTRFRTWMNEAITPVRAFRLQRYQRSQEAHFHPELPLLIIESLDAAEVWDLREEEKPLLPNEELRCAAWDPVSGLLATSSQDGIVVLRESPSFQVRQTLTVPDGCITRLTFNQEGSLLGIGGMALSLWDLQKGEWLGSPRPHTDTVAWITFDSERKRVVTASGDEARLYAMDSSNTEPLHPPFIHYRWTPHAARLFQPVFHRGHLLTNGGQHPKWEDAYRQEDYRTRIWDLDSGQEIDHLPLHPLRLNPNGRSLRVSRGIWDFQSEDYTLFLNGLADRGVFHPDGSGYVGWRDLGTVFDLNRGKETQRLGEGFYDPVTVLTMGMAPHGRLLAAVFRYPNEPPHVVVFRNWQKPRSVSIMPLQGQGNAHAILSPNEALITFPGVPEDVVDVYVQVQPRVFDAATGEPLGPNISLEGESLTGAFVDNERTLLLCSGAPRAERERSGYRIGHAQLWDWRTGEPLSDRLSLPSEPRDALRSPDGSWIAVLCHGRELVHLDAKGTRVTLLAPSLGTNLPRRARRDESFLEFAADGTLIYQAKPGETHLWSPEAVQAGGPPQVIATSNASIHTRVVSQQHLFLTDGDQAELTIIDRTNSQRQALGIVGSSPMTALAWSESQKTLITGEKSGFAQLWHLPAEGTPELVSRREHANELTAAALLPNTPWALTHAQGTGVSFWDRQTGSLIAPPITFGTYAGQQLLPSLDGRRVIITPTDPSALSVALDEFQPSEQLSIEDEQLLAEICNHGHIDENGAFVRFPKDVWFAKWQMFRTRHPDYHDTQLTPSRETLARYHRERALAHPWKRDHFACRWHLKRWAAATDSLEPWAYLLEINEPVPDDIRTRLDP